MVKPGRSFVEQVEKMNDDDDNGNYDDFDAHINQIIRRRMIPRRTNWRYRYMALGQREVAEANLLQLSILEHAQFFMAMILLSNQLLTILHLFRRQNAGQNNSRVQGLTPVLRYYTCLVAFCYLWLDNLFLEEAELVGIIHNQWEAMVAMEVFSAPRNRSLNEISEGDAHRLTRFWRVKLQSLLDHWRIPEVIVAGTNCYTFTGEKMLIVSLSKMGFCGCCCVRTSLGEIPDDGVLHSSGLLTTYLSTSTTRFLVIQSSCR